MGQVQLLGESLAKGRNGYFKLDHIDTLRVKPSVWDGRSVIVELFSKRIGDAPPIALQLTRKDAEMLCAAIKTALAEKPL